MSDGPQRVRLPLSTRHVDAFFFCFVFFIRTSSAGGRGGALSDFSSSFPCLADHERNWPLYKVVFPGWQPIR